MSINFLPCTKENIFSIELCVAKVTFSFSESSAYFSPTTAKSKTLYIRRASQRPNWRSRPEKTGFSLALTLESAKTYSRHAVAGVKIIGAFGNDDDAPWSLLCPQSDTCSKRRVRKTFETVKARTEMMLKFRRRHGVCKVTERDILKWKSYESSFLRWNSSKLSLKKFWYFFFEFKMVKLILIA